MVNLMQYRDVAEYADGRESTISGREADDMYAPIGPIAAVGAEIVFFAEVADQLLGDAPKWDRVAVVKYPTRRSFVEMQNAADFRELHEHKDAGMEATIVAGAQPMAAPANPDAPDWADVPHPPTADDPPVVVLHLIRFVDGGIPDMTSYTDAASKVAVPHGVRIAGWFGIEGTIIGDGRAVGPGPLQRVPEPRGVHGGRLRPRPARGAQGPPRARDRRHVHADPAADDRPARGLDRSAGLTRRPAARENRARPARLADSWTTDPSSASTASPSATPG